MSFTSPFANKKSKSFYQKKAPDTPTENPNQIYAVHVKPVLADKEVVLEGYGIYCNGYGGKQLGDMFYQRGNNVTMLEEGLPVPWCFKVCDQGVPRTRTGTNGNEYGISLVVFVAEPGMKFSKDTVEMDLEQRVIPWLNKYIDNTETKKFVLAEDWYTTVDTWSDLVGIEGNDSSALMLITKAFCHENQKLPAIMNFFKENKGHIYSAWKIGQVPVNVIKKHKLTEVHLHQEDHYKIVTSTPSTPTTPSTLSHLSQPRGSIASSDSDDN